MKCGICLQDVEPMQSPSPANVDVCPRDGEASWIYETPPASKPAPARKTKAAQRAADQEG